VHLDELGMPTGSNTIANLPASGEFGPYAESGNLSVSVNSAGTLLCLGSNIAGEYLAVRLIRLDPHTGDIAIASGSQSAYWHSILLPGEGPIKLSDTPAATGKLTLAGNTAYYVSPKASLRSFTLPDLANPAPLAPADVAGFTEGIQTVSMTSHVGPVPLAETSIVVAVTDRLATLDRRDRSSRTARACKNCRSTRLPVRLKALPPNLPTFLSSELHSSTLPRPHPP
jgi:hypothetical protein